MLPSEYIKVSCLQCEYNCTGIPPYFNRHCSVQFYFIPHKTLDKIKNVSSYDDDIVNNKNLFQNSYLRIDCFSCLSVTNCAWTDLNISQSRLRIFKEGFARIQTTRFKNMQNFRVIDYVKKCRSIVPPRLLLQFDRQTKKDIDENSLIEDKIYPFRLFTPRFLRDLLMVKKYPGDCFQLAGIGKHEKHLPFEHGGGGNIWVDPNPPIGIHPLCKERGHLVAPNFLDKTRTCRTCLTLFGHNRHAQALRIRTFSDPFLFSSIMIS